MFQIFNHWSEFRIHYQCQLVSVQLAFMLVVEILPIYYNALTSIESSWQGLHRITNYRGKWSWSLNGSNCYWPAKSLPNSRGTIVIIGTMVLCFYCVFQVFQVVAPFRGWCSSRHVDADAERSGCASFFPNFEPESIGHHGFTEFGMTKLSCFGSSTGKEDWDCMWTILKIDQALS